MAPSRTFQNADVNSTASLDGNELIAWVQGVNIQRIRDKLSNGFKPFTIHTSDGRKLEVPHPDFIATGPGVVVVVDRRGRVHTLDALHITALEEHAPKRAAPGK